MICDALATFDERALKRARVHAVLDERRLDGIFLTDPGTVSWYLCGARSHVVSLADVGVAAVLVTRDREEVRTSVIEAPRLREEELGEDAPELVALPWWMPLDTDLGVERLGREGGTGTALDVRADLLDARAALSPPEVERYRHSGATRKAAVAEALRGARSEEPEFTTAGRAAQALLQRGCEVLVLLVAGADRLPRHRHPLPTNEPLGDRAMLVVCARRYGLVCSVTRIRAFAPLGTADHDRYRALLEVEAAGLDATRPGAPVGAAVAAMAAAYPEHGFAEDEWHRHHQGGPTGYASRDFLATPDVATPVQDGQAFAWNPSGGGFKVEDTVLATATGVELLSPDPEWPAVEVAGRTRPDVLV